MGQALGSIGDWEPQRTTLKERPVFVGNKMPSSSPTQQDATDRLQDLQEQISDLECQLEEALKKVREIGGKIAGVSWHLNRPG